MQKIRCTIPAEIGEKAQYLARKAYDNTIRFALFYPAKLRPDVMQQAAMELVTRIDILHASFTAGTYRARWSVNSDFRPEDAFTAQTEKENLMEAVHAAMLKPISFAGKLQLHCTLISDQEHSALVLTVGHMCADGADARYLLEKLLELYNCLITRGDPASVVLKNGTRNPEQCCKQLTIADRLKLYRRPAVGAKTEYVFPDSAPGSPRMICTELSAELLTVARQKAKLYGASVNDLLLTAFYRAVARQLALPEGTAMGIQSAMDLRRHIPGGDSLGVCNLSGSMSTSLETGIVGSFADTLKEVITQTAQIKEDKLAGMYDFPMMSQVFRLLPFTTVEALGAKVYGSATMALTNLGALNTGKLTADGIAPTNAIFGAHLKQKPALQIAAIGMNGAITLCSAACCTDMDAHAIQELYTLIKSELETFAGNQEV